MTRKINELSIPTDGLVLDLPLDGNANARVGSDGTATNVVWQPAERGYVSEVGSFNGSSSYVSHNAPILTTQATFSFWIYPNNAGTGLLSIVSNGENARYRIDLRNNKLEAIFGGFDKGITTNGTGDIPLVNVDNNIYQYFTITVDGNNIKVYKNGILKQSSLKASDMNTSGSTSLIGCEPDSGDTGNLGNWFPGQIGLVKIYNKALSQEEIDVLYKEGLRKFGPTSAQIWRSVNNDFPLYTPTSLPTPILDISKPQSGGLYYDQSGNGNNGTSTNVTDSAKGKYNVMNFNGLNSRVIIPDSINLRPGTGDFYFITNINTTSTSTKIALSKGPNTPSSGDYVSIITYSDGVIGFRISESRGENLEPKSGAGYNDGKNHLVVGLRESGTIKLYIDGVLIDSVGGSTVNLDNTDSIVLGNFSYLNALLYYSGKQNNASYGNGTLTEKQIQQLYYSSFIPN